jgi:hypothetical protein
MFLVTPWVRVDLDRCMGAGLRDDPDSTLRFPVEVADLSLWMLGFSGTGLGIFDSHGKSGDGGACCFCPGDRGEEGTLVVAAGMPAWHLSHSIGDLSFWLSVR